MAKAKIQFICTSCGNVSARWQGKCDACGEWNTIIEDDPVKGIGTGPGALRSARKGRPVALADV